MLGECGDGGVLREQRWWLWQRPKGAPSILIKPSAVDRRLFVELPRLRSAYDEGTTKTDQAGQWPPYIKVLLRGVTMRALCAPFRARC